MPTIEVARALLDRLERGEITLEQAHEEIAEMGSSFTGSVGPPVGSGLNLGALLPGNVLAMAPTPSTTTITTPATTVTTNGTATRTMTIASPSRRVTATASRSETYSESGKMSITTADRPSVTLSTTMPPPATPPRTGPVTLGGTHRYTFEGATQGNGTYTVTVSAGPQTITSTQGTTLPTTATTPRTVLTPTVVGHAAPTRTQILTAIAAGGELPDWTVHSFPEQLIESQKPTCVEVDTPKGTLRVTMETDEPSELDTGV